MLNKINKIEEIVKQYPKLYSLLFGILLTFSFPPYYQLWTLFVSFGFFSLLITQDISKKKAFSLGYWFGFGLFSVGFSWVANALALDLHSFGWLIPVALVASGAFFGFFIGFTALFTCFFRGYYAKIVAFAAAWAVLEWVRSFLFTGFPWNLLGSVWTFNHIWVQTASIFGTYSLSLLTVLAACLPFSLFLRPHKKSGAFGLLISFCIISGLFAFGTWRCDKLDSTENSPISLRIVQPSIPQSLKWDFENLEDNFAEYIAMSQENSLENKNIVIWGETASTFPLSLDLAHFKQVQKAIPEGGYLIAGSIDYFSGEDDRWIPMNAAHIIEDGKGITETYAKSHLVPFGEYIPLRNLIPANLRPITRTISDFMAGKGPQTFHLKDIPPVGILICYEIIFPHEIYDPSDRPEWIINLTNDGWYGLSAGPYQHLATAQLRAVEEGLTIVRAANSGISALISKTGKIVDYAPLAKKQNLDVFLPHNLSSPTIYTQYGNFAFFEFVLFVLFIAVLCSFYAGRIAVDKRKKH